VIREQIGAGALALVALVVLLIFLSNRAKRAKQERRLSAPAAALRGEHPFTAYYVATVFADQPLERVWAFGLGGRGQAQLQVSDQGISVVRTGEVGFLIPAKQLGSVQRSSATIDKAVEKDGLLSLVWDNQETLITHIRIVDLEQRKKLEDLITKALGVEIE
jgi:hypothetical protein